MCELVKFVVGRQSSSSEDASYEVMYTSNLCICIHGLHGLHLYTTTACINNALEENENYASGYIRRLHGIHTSDN